MSPPHWPQPHPPAQDFDLFWLVRQLPPNPFPVEDYDYGSDNRFGPPGTRWIFSLESLWNRQTEPGVSQGVKAAIERLFKKLAIKLPPAGTSSWATPYALAGPAAPVEMELGVMMRWIRTQIVGKVGDAEEVVHVHNWRHSTIENADVDAIGVKTVGNAVRNAWHEFLTVGGGVMPAELVYTEVRASVLEQAAPGEKPVWVGSTQVSPFSPDSVGHGGFTTLPYEVALAVSLNTNFRGTSRFRGRTYLGPLQANVLGQGGLFSASVVNPVGTSFWTNFVAALEAATDYELHIVSQKFSTSAKVTGARVGLVPDSQRRRRRDQIEAYTQVGGTPVGAL